MRSIAIALLLTLAASCAHAADKPAATPPSAAPEVTRGMVEARIKALSDEREKIAAAVAERDKLIATLNQYDGAIAGLKQLLEPAKVAEAAPPPKAEAKPVAKPAPKKTEVAKK